MTEQTANLIVWLLTGVTITAAAVAIYNCARTIRSWRQTKAATRRG